MLVYLSWFYKLSARFYQSVSVVTVLITVVGLFSRVSSMLALLLPVKIILLVGNNKVPRYFPSFLLEIPFDTLVQLLCAATIVLYAFYLILEKLSQKLEAQAETLLLKDLTSTKNLDSRARKLIRKAYSKVAANLTELCFVLSALLFIGFSYPSLLLVLLSYSALIVVGYEVATNCFNLKVTEDISDLTAEDEGDENAGNIGAFICFLILRRSSGGIKRVLKNFAALYNQKVYLSEIFFNKTASNSDIAGSIGGEDNLSSMISSALNDAFPEGAPSANIATCYDANDDQVKCCLLEWNSQGVDQHYLIKLFQKNGKKARAEFEMLKLLDKAGGDQVRFGKKGTLFWVLVNLGASSA